MTNLVGTIADSSGSPLSGTLAVNLPASMINDSTTPDSIYTTKAKTFTITSGVVNITLPESETSSISYHFKFTASGDTTPLFEFDAIVPNIGSYEFSSLIPTGITNDTLDTGALRVAKLLANDSQLSALIRPSQTFQLGLDSVTTSTIRYCPKPFSGAFLARELHIIAISGYTGWTFQFGTIDSSGNDEILTIASTSTTIQNGREKIIQTYNLSKAASIMGFFIKAVAPVGATPIIGSLLATYSEIPA
jgi:hypothetical protein